MSKSRTALSSSSALAIITIAIAVPAPANATHKNWQLKNSGSQCFFTSYSASEPPWGYRSINNITSSARFAICPVNLAGRWGSSANATFPVPRWAVAMSAKAMIVNNNTNGSVFDCNVRARLSTQSIYFSARASTTTPGAQKLIVASNNQWGGTLEAAQNNTLLSMDFDCRVPGVPTNGSASYIDAYQVKICQMSSVCVDGGAPDHEGSASLIVEDNHHNFVQTSGIECTVSDYHEANNVQRGYAGIKNNASYGVGVFCPITQPSDDSWYHERKVSEATVYYASPTAGTPRPSCFLGSNIYSTSSFPLDTYSTPEFVAGSSGTVVQHAAGLTIGKDLSLGIWCNVQAGQTIKGVTARLSQTPIGGGS